LALAMVPLCMICATGRKKRVSKVAVSLRRDEPGAFASTTTAICSRFSFCCWHGVPKAQTSSAQGETLGIRDGDNIQIIPEPQRGDPRRLALIRADDARCRGSSFQDSDSRRVCCSRLSPGRCPGLRRTVPLALAMVPLCMICATGRKKRVSKVAVSLRRDEPGAFASTTTAICSRFSFCCWHGVPKAQTSSAQGETLGIRDGDNTQIIPEPQRGDPRRLALIRADDARCRGSSFQDSDSRRVWCSRMSPGRCPGLRRNVPLALAGYCLLGGVPARHLFSFFIF
jgi:hypothetical protein